MLVGDCVYPLNVCIRLISGPFVKSAQKIFDAEFGRPNLIDQQSTSKIKNVQGYDR